MAKDLFWTVVTFAIIISVLVLAFWPQDRNQVVIKYDCRHLVSDAPVAVQEECKRRSTK